MVPKNETQHVRRAQNEMEARIRAAREILRPTEVQFDHVPNWFRLAMIRGLRPPRGVSRGWWVLQHAIERFGMRCAIDHCGSTVLDGKHVFVSEPYALSTSSVAALKSFSDAIGVRFTIEGNSWHYPGSTIRIVFWPPATNEGVEPLVSAKAKANQQARKGQQPGATEPTTPKNSSELSPVETRVEIAKAARGAGYDGAGGGDWAAADLRRVRLARTAGDGA